jgi:hypothetical protein
LSAQSAAPPRLQLGHVLALVLRTVIRRPVPLVVMIGAGLGTFRLFGLLRRALIEATGGQFDWRNSLLQFAFAVALNGLIAVGAAWATLASTPDPALPRPIQTGRLPNAFLAAALMVMVGSSPALVLSLIRAGLIDADLSAAQMGYISLGQFPASVLAATLWAPAVAEALAGGGSLPQILGRSARLTQSSRWRIVGGYLLGFVVLVILVAIASIPLAIWVGTGFLRSQVYAWSALTANLVTAVLCQVANAAIRIDLQAVKGVSADSALLATFD